MAVERLQMEKLVITAKLHFCHCDEVVGACNCVLAVIIMTEHLINTTCLY